MNEATIFTPIKPAEINGKSICVKWDDEYTQAGIRGGKVRACWTLAQAVRQRPQGETGLITASARKSPQAQIVARIADKLGVPARLHMPKGQDTPEMKDVRNHCGEIVQHKAGYNNVIIRRALDDHAARPGWVYIPFGMESEEAMKCTVPQVAQLAHAKALGVRRVVVVVGSGMTMCAILHGLRKYKIDLPVLGVRIGADPTKRIRKFAPPFSQGMFTLVDHTKKQPYHETADAAINGVRLDPIYESKCQEYLEDNDLLWVVGIRAGIERNLTE